MLFRSLPLPSLNVSLHLAACLASPDTNIAENAAIALVSFIVTLKAMINDERSRHSEAVVMGLRDVLVGCPASCLASVIGSGVAVGGGFPALRIATTTIMVLDLSSAAFTPAIKAALLKSSLPRALRAVEAAMSDHYYDHSYLEGDFEYLEMASASASTVLRAIGAPRTGGGGGGAARPAAAGKRQP